MRQRDTQLHTYADYLIWSATYGNELVDGIAYVRDPPSPSRVHQETVGEIYRQLANALQGKRARAYLAPLDVRLPKQGDADDSIGIMYCQFPRTCARNPVSRECRERRPGKSGPEP
jgi:hypothetical protein